VDVIASVKCIRVVWTPHSVFETLHYDTTRKSFLLDQQSLKGLHSAISDCFFPAYTFDRATLGPVEETKTKTKSPGRRQTAAKQRAQIRGLLLNVRDFLLPKHAEVRDARLAVRHRIQTLRGTLNKHTREIIRVLSVRDLRPIQSQVVVCHEELRIGTAADLITHNMLSPFTKMNDSPHNQHMIQLALTMSMYARVYGLKIQNLEAYVVRSYAGGVTVYPLEAWARTAIPAMHAALFQHERIRKELRHG